MKRAVDTCTSPLGKPNDPSLIGNICNVLGGRGIEKAFLIITFSNVANDIIQSKSKNNLFLGFNQ